MKFLLVLVVLSSVRHCLLAQTSTTPESPPTLHRVSMEQLLAKPQQYDGQLVQLNGYLHLAYEAHALYRQADDLAKHQLKNSLWVNFSAVITKGQLVTCNQAYVTVVGTFDARSKGHLGLFAGTLKNIISLNKQPPIK